MKANTLLIATIVGTLVMALLVVFLISKSAEPKKIVVDQAILLNGANHILGPQDAPVTIVEFSDFQCPSCMVAQTYIKQVLAKYPDKVKFVYRHFPLKDIHQYANLAAVSSEVVSDLAASDSAKFWAYHDELFTKQDEWSRLETPAKVMDQFMVYAQDSGIDKAKLRERIEDKTAQARVDADFQVGIQAKITGTPSFFVNGTLYSAADLDQAVAALLKK